MEKNEMLKYLLAVLATLPKYVTPEQLAEALSAYRTAVLQDAIDADIEAAIAEIDELISIYATPQNKLVSQTELGDAVSSVEAKQLYKTASQGSFATKAELTAATVFYNADGTTATPTRNDVAYVVADETRGGRSAKYVIANEPTSGSDVVWGFVITFSDIVFSQAQMDAINSGINGTKRTNYDSHVANGNIHVTAGDKTNWNDKEAKGKITIGGVEKTANSHTVTIVTNGVESNFTLVGVN